jgi:acetolactate decarboxylase
MKSAKFFFLFFILSLFSCARPPQYDAIQQLSTYDALLSGFYDGRTRLQELKQAGDFGIGTFDRLDGEMVMLNGHIYQVQYSGQVRLMPDSARTPYADVCFFRTDQNFASNRVFDFKSMQTLLDSLLVNPNLFYAVKVQARFQSITTRSVAAQQKPYQPLVEAVKKQAVFEFRDVAGTLVGFRIPTFAKGVNVPGYHFHFLSDDRQQGGHVMAGQWTGMSIQIDEIRKFNLTLPADDTDFKTLDLGRDASQDAVRVMSGK